MTGDFLENYKSVRTNGGADLPVRFPLEIAEADRQVRPTTSQSVRR